MRHNAAAGSAATGRICLSYPELVHAHKGRRIFGLKNVPKFEVSHSLVTREAPTEALQHLTGQVEPKEIKSIFAKKRTNLGEIQLMFLNVKQQVAAGAGAVKVYPLCCLRQRRIVAKAREFLTTSPDFWRSWAIAALGNESPGR